MNLRERLDTLCNNPRLIALKTDVDFAESLRDSYSRSGSLSRGRKSWLEKLEVKYDEETFVDPLSTEMGTIIKALLANETIEPRDRGFIESIRNQYVRWNNMSDKQSNALMSVFEKYSPEGQAKRDKWIAEYKQEHQKDTTAVAQYYKANPPYFQDIVTNVLTDENFVPTKRQFNRLTKNKYALKIIANTHAEPKYKVDDVIEARDHTGTYSNGRYELAKGQKGFIIKVNSAPVISAAKGSKRYLILPIGSAVPLHVEERTIKKAKI
jgi:hypothetical protein